MARPTRITIDDKALQHNAQQVRRLAPGRKILATLKANAYGHGLRTVAEALAADVDAFGLACIEEALMIRKLGINKRVVLLEGFFSADELAVISEQQFDIVVHSMEQLHILEQAPATLALQVWLKIDTGMHRLGFAASEVQAVWQRLMACPAVKLPPVLMTHFASAEVVSDPSNTQQLQTFLHAVKDLPGEHSLANSAAVLTHSAAWGQWLRPGLMLYGVSPLPGQTAEQHNLLPAMTFQSQLVATKSLQTGDAIGYGGRYVCPEPMRIGLVPVGYGDGYPYHAPNGTPVLLNATRVPLVGRVSMDRLAVDLRSQPQAKVGDPVVLWGKGLPVETVAGYCHTITYDLLCGLQRRAQEG